MNAAAVTPLPYEAIIPLDPARHRDLGIDPHRAMATFAATAYWAPIVTGEFAQAAAHHPILFDAADSSCDALVLLARTEGHNPFVIGDGEWSPRTYIPERFRCYPLVPPESGRDTIGIDEVAMVPDPADEGVPLFDAAGAPSATARALLGVLRRHARDRRATRRLQVWLEELDLLVPRELSIASADGWCYRLAQFRVVDAGRLGRLPEVTLARLERDGLLALIEIHLRSLANLGRLPPPRDALAESLAAHDDDVQASAVDEWPGPAPVPVTGFPAPQGA